MPVCPGAGETQSKGRRDSLYLTEQDLLAAAWELPDQILSVGRTLGFGFRQSNFLSPQRVPEGLWSLRTEFNFLSWFGVR